MVLILTILCDYCNCVIFLPITSSYITSLSITSYTLGDSDLSELATANSTLMYKLQNKVSKLLTHNVIQSPSVKELIYESGCLSKEEIANSEAAKDTQQSQYITAVLQSKNLATFRNLLQFLVSRKDQDAAQKLLLIFSDGLSKGEKTLSVCTR